MYTQSLLSMQNMALIFHISEIILFMEKYEHIENLCFEVQVWDTSLLRKWKQ